MEIVISSDVSLIVCLIVILMKVEGVLANIPHTKTDKVILYRFYAKHTLQQIASVGV